MNCDFEQVQRYHDDQLDATAAREIESHVDACEPCRSFLTELRSLSSMFAGASLPEVDMQRVNAIAGDAWRAANDRGVRRLAGWITAVAAAVMLFVMFDVPSNSTDTAMNPFGTTSPNSVSYASAEWERNAITPLSPVAIRADENDRDLVQFAQWMASDLSARQD